MEEYKIKICSMCINKICKNNIIKTEENKTIVIKCKDYIKNNIDKNKNLDKYINEFKLKKQKEII